jgi:hypothetical protein
MGLSRSKSSSALSPSPSSANALLRIERLGRRAPGLLRAYREGEISWVQAQALVRIAERAPEHAGRWVAFARRVSVRRLRDDVDRALLLADRDAGLFAHTGGVPDLEAELAAASDAEAERVRLQTGANPRDMEATSTGTGSDDADPARLQTGANPETSRAFFTVDAESKAGSPTAGGQVVLGSHRLSRGRGILTVAALGSLGLGLLRLLPLALSLENGRPAPPGYVGYVSRFVAFLASEARRVEGTDVRARLVALAVQKRLPPASVRRSATSFASAGSEPERILGGVPSIGTDCAPSRSPRFAGSLVAAATSASSTVLSLVDLDGAAAEVAPVEGADRIVCGARFLHLDEGEASRAAGLAVRDDVHGLDGAVPSEGILEVCLRAREGKVSDVDLLAHLMVLSAPVRNPNEAR